MEGFRHEQYEVNSTEDLLNTPICKRFANDKTFYRFSFTQNNNEHHWTLIAEYEKGFKWWVVGFCDEKPDLPKWVPRFTIFERIKNYFKEKGWFQKKVKGFFIEDAIAQMNESYRSLQKDIEEQLYNDQPPSRQNFKTRFKMFWKS